MERITNNELPTGLMQTMLEVEAYLAKTGLNKTTLELMRTRVSQINGCAYCLDMHSKEAINSGESIQRLISVSAWREAPYYTPQERAVLGFAEILTRMEEGVQLDQIHEELLKFFTKHEIAHLSLAIAQINSWNRLVRSFGPIAGNYNIETSVPRVNTTE